jgi:hypothetical protein
MNYVVQENINVFFCTHRVIIRLFSNPALEGEIIHMELD